MKIAIIAHAQHPVAEPFSGGLESFTHSFCRELQERGYEVDLYAHRASDPRFRIIPVDVISADASVARHSREIATEARRSAFEMGENIRYGSALTGLRRENYDLIHNHSLHPVPMLMGAAVGIPMITTLHNPPIPYLKMSALAVRDAPQHHFTAVSRHLAETWSAYTGEAEIILNGIETDRWNASGIPQPNSAFWFGRICVEKAPHHAIEAARRAGFSLKLAGPIYDQAYFEKEFAPRLHGDAEYLGHLGHADLKRHLQESAVTLFTSVWQEPYGLTIAESLASGSPVLAYDVGAAPEILTAKCGVVVPVGDIDALAAALPQAAHLTRSACRERAESFCGIATMMEGYERLYRRLIR